VKRFRGGLVFKAHRLLHHSALGSRVIKQKKKKKKRKKKHRPPRQLTAEDPPADLRERERGRTGIEPFAPHAPIQWAI